MELSIESAFSPGGIVGNLSYILLILSMAMRRIFWLRSLAILSGLTGIAYDAIWLNNPVGVFWESCFTLTNLVQWLLLIREDRKLKLTKREIKIWQKFLGNLSARECKQFLAAATKVHITKGQHILKAGEPVGYVYVILSGQVDITVDQNTVSRCIAGDLLGEMSFLTAKPASADAIVSKNGEALEIGQDQLAGLIKAFPQLGQSVSNLISRNMATKLDRQNRFGPRHA